MIPVHVLGHKGYVYSAQDAARLRTEFRIVGNMVGGLTSFKNQTSVNGLPLELSQEEITLGLENEWIRLVSGPNDPCIKTSKPTEKMDTIMEHERADSSTAACGPEEVPEEMPISLDDALSIKRAIVIPNMKATCSTGSSTVAWTFPTNQEERVRYAVFKDLHERGMFLTGAAKFGGDWLAYPGDPLVYHAHFVVRVLHDQKVSPLVLASISREAHAARKHLLLTTVEQEGDSYTPVYLSVAPVAGFGQSGKPSKTN